MMTLRPLGPRVTETALARTSTPARRDCLPSLPKRRSCWSLNTHTGQSLCARGWLWAVGELALWAKRRAATRVWAFGTARRAAVRVDWSMAGGCTVLTVHGSSSKQQQEQGAVRALDSSKKPRPSPGFHRLPPDTRRFYGLQP